MLTQCPISHNAQALLRNLSRNNSFSQKSKLMIEFSSYTQITEKRQVNGIKLLNVLSKKESLQLLHHQLSRRSRLATLKLALKLRERTLSIKRSQQLLRNNLHQLSFHANPPLQVSIEILHPALGEIPCLTVMIWLN